MVGLVVAVPEIWGALATVHPWMPLSHTLGHLEDRRHWIALVVVAVIGLPAYTTRAYPPASSWDWTQPGLRFRRTPGGRFTLGTSHVLPSPMEFDDDTTSTVVAVALLGLWALVGAATWAAARWWGDGPHYHPAYVLYGLTALVWIVLPSVLAFLTARDAPYSTLARSVANLDAWLGSRGGTMRGLLMALLFGYLISMAAYVLLHVILAPG